MEVSDTSSSTCDCVCIIKKNYGVYSQNRDGGGKSHKHDIKCVQPLLELGSIDDFAVYHRVFMYSARHDQKIILEIIKMSKTIRQTKWPLQCHDLKET